WDICEFSFFGSVLRDDFHSDSDIDVLVTFKESAKHTLFDLVHTYLCGKCRQVGIYPYSSYGSTIIVYYLSVHGIWTAKKGDDIDMNKRKDTIPEHFNNAEEAGEF
ncbi:MAG: nucleotidyltransferase domain-containing protein, partial [Euryarchaeota archaeon]|nr:nucleotidyltransferase domain-containing protein [Euryarchaeota archaeon]